MGAAEGEVFLGLDTCTRVQGLALVGPRGEAIGAEAAEVTTHSTRLLKRLRDLMEGAGVRRADLAAVGAVTGPGSFTGLRIGMAATLGLSKALGIPAFGLDSLTALALASGEEGEGLALLDARRSEVYAGAFTLVGGRIEKNDAFRSLPPAAVLERHPRPEWAAGDGVPLVGGWPEGCRLHPLVPNLGLQAADHARRLFLEGIPPGDLLPTYVRPPDVRPPASFDPRPS